MKARRKFSKEFKLKAIEFHQKERDVFSGSGVTSTLQDAEKEAELAIFDYIETWYNRQRRHSAVDGMTILEFEKLNYKKQAA